MARPKEPRDCARCGASFRPRTRMHLYCSPACARAVDKERTGFRAVSSVYRINRLAVSAIAEYRVCVDLLQRGYLVYRAVASTAGCDIIAFRNGGPPLRVEVRTAYERNGRVYHGAPATTDHDVLAAATADAIYYEPPLDTIRQ